MFDSASSIARLDWADPQNLIVILNLIFAGITSRVHLAHLVVDLPCASESTKGQLAQVNGTPLEVQKSCAHLFSKIGRRIHLWDPGISGQLRYAFALALSLSPSRSLLPVPAPESSFVVKHIAAAFLAALPRV